MTTFTISLPDQTAKIVDLESKKNGFATRSEFVRDLLRKYFLEQDKFEVFKAIPVNEIKFHLAKTGKYSQKFIESVAKGLSKSSSYAN